MLDYQREILGTFEQWRDGLINEQELLTKLIAIIMTHMTEVEARLTAIESKIKELKS